jgi:hypothetical protein
LTAKIANISQRAKGCCNVAAVFAQLFAFSVCD